MELKCRFFDGFAPVVFLDIEKMRDDYPSQLKRKFIGAAVVIGAVLLGAFVLHLFYDRRPRVASLASGNGSQGQCFGCGDGAAVSITKERGAAHLDPL